MKAVAFSDGGCRKDIAGYGVFIQVHSPKIRVVEISEPLKGASNNEAEYQGLLAALRWAVQNKVHDLEMVMDSEVIVRQMTGRYECRAPNLIPLYNKAKHLTMKIPIFSIQHVRREFNTEADRLANEAMDRGFIN
jgi:ribonuclease HI